MELVYQTRDLIEFHRGFCKKFWSDIKNPQNALNS